MARRQGNFFLECSREKSCYWEGENLHVSCSDLRAAGYARIHDDPERVYVVLSKHRTLVGYCAWGSSWPTRQNKGVGFSLWARRVLCLFFKVLGPSFLFLRTQPTHSLFVVPHITFMLTFYCPEVSSLLSDSFVSFCNVAKADFSEYLVIIDLLLWDLN